MLADVAAAGERDLAHAAVLHEEVAELAARPGQRADALRRQPGLQQDLRELERRQRGVGRRLDDHGIAAGDGRADLVADEVQREVERRDGDDDPARHPQRDAELPLAGRHRVERHRLAVQPAGRLGRLVQGVDRAGGLQPALGQDLALLERDRAAELLHPGREEIGGLAEDGRPLVGREPGHRAGAPLGGLQRALDVAAIGARHGVDHRVVVGVADLDRLGLVDPLTGHVHLHVSTSRGGGHPGVAPPASSVRAYPVARRQSFCALGCFLATRHADVGPTYL